MSDFNGLEGMDLSDVEVSTNRILSVGRHVVKINDAVVEKDDGKDTARLVLSYENSDGSIRQWIYLYHGGSPKATEGGVQGGVQARAEASKKKKATTAPHVFNLTPHRVPPGCDPCPRHARITSHRLCDPVRYPGCICPCVRSRRGPPGVNAPICSVSVCRVHAWRVCAAVSHVA